MRTIFDKLKKKYQRKRKVRSEKVFTPKPVEEVKEVKKAECKKCKVTDKKNIKVKKKTYGGVRK